MKFYLALIFAFIAILSSVNAKVGVADKVPTCKALTVQENFDVSID